VAAAATLPRAEAEAVEEAAFPRLAASPEAKALQHLFFAERAAARLADVAPDTRPLPVQRVGVVGAGTMGTGIALAFANAGFDVRLFDPGTGAMERSAAARAKTYASAVRRGRMTEAEADAAAARILPAASLADLAPSDLVVEAVIEDMAIKKQVLGELDGLIRPEALLATNTSFLDIDELAAATRHPGRVLGLHFFSPAQVMRLVEVVRAAATSDAALVTAMAVVRRLGKVGVVAGVCDGFIGNRMIDQYFLEACELLMQGATPRQVDDALRGFGMAMGPFAMSDMAGNDVSWFARKRRYAADPGFRFPEIADALAERGWFGQKTGQGWYLYPDGTREGVDSPDLAALLAACRAAAGIAPRRIGADEIAERCIYALVNEGAKLLDEGIAARASDIDVVYARGYGFPDLKGGPMHHAEAVGLARVLERVRSFGQGARFPLWEPARLLEDSAKAGRWAK
jgi:3-hydroxyacyl-CoA dehydrogenase